MLPKNTCKPTRLNYFPKKRKKKKSIKKYIFKSKVFIYKYHKLIIDKYH